MFADGCFGAAAYPDAANLPEAALRASLGCGNPLAVASLQPGETVLDLGSGGGLDVLLSARRVGPTGTAYGVDASTDMLQLARANAARAELETPSSCTGISRTSRYLAGRSTWSYPTASLTCPPTKPASWPRRSGSYGPAGAWASATSPPTTAWIPASAAMPNSGRLHQRHLDPVQVPRPAASSRVYSISITRTHEACAGLHSVIIQAAKRPLRMRDHPPGDSPDP